MERTLRVRKPLVLRQASQDSGRVPTFPRRAPAAPGGVDRMIVQARLSVGPADDRFEREADTVAAAVMRSIAAHHDGGDAPARAQRSDTAPHGVAPADTPRIGRMQRSSRPSAEGGVVDNNTESRIQRARGHGQPLQTDVRRSMEAGFGTDFGAVRIHTDTEAQELNSRVQAKAFTTGNDIFFQRGNYQPSSSDGQELLAHELTHVVQQNGTDQVSLQRAIDVDQVREMAGYLGIEGPVRVVEVPKNAKIRTTTPFSDYPAASKMNLTSELEAKSIILLDYPDWDTNPEYDADFKGYFAGQPATVVTDGLGGGAYNHLMDLVVLREPYSEPELLHEMGHKAQGDAGINADTATVLFLEYQNVLLTQNSPWWLGKEGADPPRLQYSSTGISATKISAKYGVKRADDVTDQVWEDFKKAAATAVHHSNPRAVEVLESIESTLAGRYSRESDEKGRFDKQVKFNLIAEYLEKL
jgi:hypothetical protein